jgi:glycoprotease/Kae1 family metallohydrolase
MHLPVLGIESSAHTFGVGVVDNGKIIANEKSMYSIGTGGMVPGAVAEFHASNARSTISSALASSGASIKELEAVGYTRGPGLGPCLRVGFLAASTLAARLGVPLIPVNHGVAHIEVAKHVCRMRDPLALYVSGGNSQIVALSSSRPRRYTVYGETLDIGVGNMLDVFARSARLEPAWGSSVAKVAHGGSYVEMPYTVKGMDFAFAGLLTKATSLLGGHSTKDVAYSLQETAFSMLCEATERAMMLTGRRELLTCGGVAQSSRLREMLGSMAASHHARFGVADNALNADNGAMIALVAEKIMRSGSGYGRTGINQRDRPDSVIVTW